MGGRYVREQRAALRRREKKARRKALLTSQLEMFTLPTPRATVPGTSIRRLYNERERGEAEGRDDSYWQC